MANVLIEESTMSNIANAIRSKTGKSDLILPKNMASEIGKIEAGGSDDLLNKVINRTVTNITINTDIGGYCFFNCGYINPTFGDNCNIIGDYAFQNCGRLTEINTNKVTIIKGNAFMGLGSLAKAVLPNVIEINSGAFNNCRVLNTLIIKSTTICNLKTIGALSNTPIAQGTGYIYVPKNLVEQYKVETNWVTYAEQIRAIEDYPEITGGV